MENSAHSHLMRWNKSLAWKIEATELTLKPLNKMGHIEVLKALHYLKEMNSVT